MAITVKPKTLATGGPYTPTGELGPTQWNDGHEIEMASQRVLGRVATGAGDAEELKGMWVEVSRAVADDDATVDFTGIDSTADEWMVQIYSAKGSANNAYMMLRTSSNGGSSYDASGDDYYQVSATAQALYPVYGTESLDVFGDGTGAEIYLGWAGATGNASADTGSSTVLTIIRPADTAIHTQFAFHNIVLGGDYYKSEVGAAVRKSAGKVDAIRFLFDSGDIASGTFVLLKRLK